MKALEAYSVLRMNDAHFTSALKQKVSSPNLERNTVESPQISRKTSISSSGSSTQGSRPDINLEIGQDEASGSLATPSFSTARRYSSSFLEVHKIHNSKCPPYTSQETVHREPPPYTEQPMLAGQKVNDDISPLRPDSPKARRKPFSMLQKVKIKSPFTLVSKSNRSPHERRKLFSRKSSSAGSSSEGAKTTETQSQDEPESLNLGFRLSDSHSSIETAV